MSRAAWLVGGAALTLVLSSMLPVVPAAQNRGGQEGGWQLFDGTWSATGQRQTLSTEGSRLAAVVQLSGAVVLSHGVGLSTGFRGEAIGFDDGRSSSSGRALWTDGRGDKVFSVLNGEAIETGRRITGTITGGTGRYSGITGDYTLTWQYVIRDEGDAVQGRAVDLKGRFRLAEPNR